MDNTSTPAPKKIRIVLLEDEKLLANLFEFCIQEWFKNFELLKFRSGDGTWQELSRTEPDLLIMDAEHPGLKGNEIMEKLAAQKARFGILLTSDYFLENLETYRKHGLKVHFLPKPFGIQQYWDALGMLVGPSDFPERHKRMEHLFELRG